MRSASFVGKAAKQRMFDVPSGVAGSMYECAYQTDNTKDILCIRSISGGILRKTDYVILWSLEASELEGQDRYYQQIRSGKPRLYRVLWEVRT